MKRLGFIIAAGAITAVLVGWFLVVKLPNWFAPKPASAPAPPPAAETAVRKIRARLFYVAEDGMRLVGIDRDVPYGATPPEQAQAIVEELLKPAPAPQIAPLPDGTSLRSVFVTDAGDAYVDLSKEAAAAHTGGSLDELFSVYAVVNSLTVNLPAVRAVQILIDGKETDSLAGHIDLRGPLPRSDRWVSAPAATSSAPADGASPATPADGTPRSSGTPTTPPSPLPLASDPARPPAR